MRRLLGPLLLVILVLGVALGIYLSSSEQAGEREEQLRRSQMITVSGLIGSEKEGFLTDPRLLRILESQGIQLKVTKAGSRQMATSVEAQEQDFLFPAGMPAAEKIKQKLGVHRSYDVFYTPLAIASWAPIARILESNGMVQKRGDHLYITRMKNLLDAIAGGKRWRDLQDSQDYAIGKKVLISSTDVRTSNSAAMYLALASYVANGEEIVSSEAQADAVMPLMTILFLKQGFQEASSAGPFEDYTSMGMGKAPMVMIYESQYIEYAAAQKESLRADMVLMYPEPTIFTKHIFIPLNPKAERLGELLENDPTLRRLAIEHGFRNGDVGYFQEFTRNATLQLPDNLTHVIDPPRFEIIESMTKRLESQYQ